MRKRDIALTTFKTCPCCRGRGLVSCTGREYYQQLSKEWADSLDGKMVTVPFLFDGRANDNQGRWGRIPGLAMAHKGRGGWWNVRVYVSIDRGPGWGGYGRMLPGSSYDEEHDIIMGRRVYYLERGHPRAKEIVELDIENINPVLHTSVLSKLLKGQPTEPNHTVE